MCYKNLRQVAGDYAQENQQLKKDYETMVGYYKTALEQYNKVVEQNKDLQKELQPFRQIYFKNLSTTVIAEMAKSQLRATAQQIEQEHLIDYIYKTIGNAGAENALRIIKQAIEKYRGRNGKS